MSKTRIPRLRILLPYVKGSYSMTQEPAPMSKTRIPRLRILLPYVKDSYSMTQEPAPMSKAHNPCSNSGTALPTTTPLRSSALNNCRPTSLAFSSTDSSPQALYSGDEHPVALAKSAKNRPLNRFANITVCEYILKPLCQSGVWCVCVLHLFSKHLVSCPGVW